MRTGTGRRWGWRPVDEHRMGTGAGAGTESRAVAETGTGTKTGTGTGTMTGSGKGGGEANKRRKPHKNYRRDQALLFRTRHHLCRQGIELPGTRQLCSQGWVPIHAHRTEGVTGSERREGSNGVGSGIGDGGGNGDGNGVGSGTGMGMEWELERERGWRRTNER